MKFGYVVCEICVRIDRLTDALNTILHAITNKRLLKNSSDFKSRLSGTVIQVGLVKQRTLKPTDYTWRMHTL